MPTQDGQFEYPETGWSVGKMAKAGPRQGVTGKEFKEIEGLRKQKQGEQLSQALTPEEWQQYWQGNWDVVGPHHKIDPTKAGPEGILIDNNNPQIKELEDSGWSTHDIPHDEWKKGFRFMRPPQDDKTPVGEMQPETAVG